ncbi:type II toxin-antitoxin system HicB family antitoxin [Prosthecomicrobium pneumaticum]|uniref:Putative RNase H-like HicB family nuclease n=1 Tax=Prosthecomicrobium pneumaticum TaxID=81895 RepID=A0A7W9CTG2_9HYPH|nr:type II toxin-antitoxin system HicB family antitoxin [Prosthecomicrobium pneumaticum]MBB5751336.1 putative RNase H-like HicB family nuclease [Prosthecomicrobium pneumaticum]
MPQSTTKTEIPIETAPARRKDRVAYVSYRALFTPAPEPGFVLGSFPDLPEALVKAAGEAEAREQANLTLAETLRARLSSRQPLFPGLPIEDGELIPVDPVIIAKLALIAAFEQSSITPSELARRMGASERDARSALDPLEPTPLTVMGVAIAAIGEALDH